ncbi:hypothetical protein Tco_1123368 [Tanacetum coccineum]|uniref:Uncharacterized protein n=1 Tax=Tanacetum coccineum TaxID=301880 RepID=A0ABQ5J371_9ASTR
MINGEVQLQALVDKKKVIITESTIRRDLQLEDANVVDCLPNATIFEELTRMGGPIEPIADKAANEENVPTHFNDPLLNGEDSLKLNELMELCTNLQKKVLDLETSKTTQALEIESLKRRVKKLEKKQRSRTHKLRRLYKVGLSAKVVSSDDEATLGNQENASKQGRKIADIDADAEVTLIDETQGRNYDLMFDIGVLDEQEVKVEKIKAAKPKVRGVMIQELSEFTTTTTTPVASKPSQDKGKAKMIKSKEPLKKKEQIRLNEELALKLQAKEEEQARLAREKAEKDKEANISWDNAKAMIEGDRLLAERLQAREQEELTDEEKARLFVELLEKRKKHFVALRA